MKQVKLISVEKFQEEEVDIPRPNDNQVLIKVKACGICGSDIHSYTGHHPLVKPPIVLGHEYSGIIKEVGDKVEGLKKGDLVTAEIVVNCGKCYACTHGKYQICEEGKYFGNIGINGAMAEYVVMEYDKIHKLPENISPQQGAMVEPAAVGVHAVRSSKFCLGDVALVIGAGVIGNFAAQALKIAGARKVIITDLVDARLEKAKEVGIDYVVNVSKVDLAKWIDENIGKDNLDVIFDCVGTEKSINTAIENARKGSQIIMIGVPPENVSLKLAFLQDREIDLLGSCMYVKDDYVRTIDLIHQDRIKTDPLITHSFPFDEYQKAYNTALDPEEAQKGRMKVIMVYQ